MKETKDIELEKEESFLLKNDILETLSNLSNSEVFTPPKIAEQMVNLIPSKEFSNPNNKFLDPVSKTGVFLKILLLKLLRGLPLTKDFKTNNWEIDKNGNEVQVIVDLTNEQERYDYILKHMLYGIAITEITQLTTRRTLYDSMNANSNRSDSNPHDENISNFNYELFDNKYGNIYWCDIDKENNEIPPKHNFIKINKDMRCKICGIKDGVEKEIENFAYPFIHKTDEELNKIFMNNFNLIKGKNMKFDVIIGNPPYQRNDGGGNKSTASSVPLYHLFVKRAIQMNPKYISMIIPSRWFATGRGLDNFREMMLNCNHIKKMIDFTNSLDCFPSVKIAGGVNYFLWDKSYQGECDFSSIVDGIEENINMQLSKYNTLVRDIKGSLILDKILQNHSKMMDSYVSKRKPYNISTNFKNYKPVSFKNSIKLYGNKFIGYIDEKEVLKNKEIISEWKVLAPKTGMGIESKPFKVVHPPKISEPNSVNTETYIVIGHFKRENEANNLLNYYKTKFFRFMVSLSKTGQDTASKVYKFVPIQDFSKSWTDEELYEKYNLSKEEIDYIESTIKEMV